MHTLKLNISDEAYSHVMFLLKSLNKKEIEIIEDNKGSFTKEKILKLLNQNEIKVFANINDPVKWQKEQRNEW